MPYISHRPHTSHSIPHPHTPIKAKSVIVVESPTRVRRSSSSSSSATSIKKTKVKETKAIKKLIDSQLKKIKNEIESNLYSSLSNSLTSSITSTLTNSLTSSISSSLSSSNSSLSSRLLALETKNSIYLTKDELNLILSESIKENNKKNDMNLKILLKNEKNKRNIALKKLQDRYDEILNNFSNIINENVSNINMLAEELKGYNKENQYLKEKIDEK